MPARTPIRNRLAKPLPERWRQWLVENRVPKRKYTVLCNATLNDGSEVELLVIEEGWVIATDLEVLADQFEQRISFDPEQISELRVIQVV